MTSESTLDKTFVLQLSKKANLIDSTVNKIIKQFYVVSFSSNFKKVITYMDKMAYNIINYMDFLNSTSIFYEDFIKAIKQIDIAYDTFLNLLNKIKSPKNDHELFYTLQRNIDNFSKSALIFISNFQEIISSYLKYKSTNYEEITNLNIRLGIESVLFTFSVDVHQIEEYPYIKSKFIEIYQFFNKINQCINPITAIQSYCGTG